MKVGKITSPVEARIELAAALALRDAKDAAKYVVIPESTTCVPKSRSQQKDSDIAACEFIEGKPLEESIQLGNN